MALSDMVFRIHPSCILVCHHSWLRAPLYIFKTSNGWDVLASRCVLCKDATEDQHNLLFGCSFAQHIWRYIISQFNVLRIPAGDFVCLHVMDSRDYCCKEYSFADCFASTVFRKIWTSRKQSIRILRNQLKLPSPKPGILAQRLP